MRITTVEIPDVKAIRRALHMSQQRFAAAFSHSAADTEELGTGAPASGCAGGGLFAHHQAPSQGGDGRRGMTRCR